jgi:hypothetical protein
MRRLLALTAAIGLIAGASSAMSPPKPPVYVRDFAFEVQHLPEDRGLLSRDAPIRRRFKGLRTGEDPVAKAHQLAALLSTTIVAELTKAGFQSQRLESGTAAPREGWLVGGEFLEVDEGNRLRRAMIGFGSGSAEVRVQVEVYDLATDPHAPFLVYGASEESRKIPGAIIFMNPYLLAARYVLSKGATEREVKQVGQQIATDLAKIIEEATSAQPGGK